MDIISFFTDLFFNLDAVLAQWAAVYGIWIYAILFVIVFMETGVVIMPFLPGDSLLFAGGAIAAVGGLNVWVIVGVLFVAAVLGDAVNYSIGRKWGRAILNSGKFSRVITPEHVAETETFFCRHGGKTISLARFFPFIRTFAPFIAGIGHMDYGRFALYNVTGAVAWIVLFVGAGYFFGNIPAVAENLEYLVIGIILVSVSPGIVHAIQRRLGRKLTPATENCAK
ncbi:MAG: DedA family protein [Coriobacteriia bacterium]|nr:DedA family protein [Coriobacteriia bacterium]